MKTIILIFTAALLAGCAHRGSPSSNSYYDTGYSRSADELDPALNGTSMERDFPGRIEPGSSTGR